MKLFTSQAEIDAAEATTTGLRQDLAVRERELTEARAALSDAVKVHFDKAKALESRAVAAEKKAAELLDAIHEQREAANGAIKGLAESAAAEAAGLRASLSAAQERLRAAQAAHDDEVARHAATRETGHGERLAHGATATALAALQNERAALVQRAEDAEALARAARAQADAEIQSFRDHIEQTKEISR